MLAGGRNSRCNPLDYSPSGATLSAGATFETPPPIYFFELQAPILLNLKQPATFSLLKRFAYFS